MSSKVHVGGVRSRSTISAPVSERVDVVRTDTRSGNMTWFMDWGIEGMSKIEIGVRPHLCVVDLRVRWGTQTAGHSP